MNIEQVRFNMVEQQIRTWDVLDTDVLDLLHVIKRETFVPTEQREYALMDIETPLTPVSKTQKMWSPRMEARILQDIALDGSEHVLEVGTGSGYLTALLAARSNKVTSVEIDPALTAFAAENLRRAKISNVSLHTGDAAHGFASAGPFDVMVFTGSMEVVPEAALTQLKAGGKLFAIVGKAPTMYAKILRKSAGGMITERTLFETQVAALENAARAPAFIF
ncbi:MAG: protein-L-isoaspartate O-methyltransferase [Burkholderiales bacterium]|nr:MAG: protein-L-isoaspartate O-methyltransferase [Betaproteobacteria bacterium]TAG24653.1 MAG: protein-L-isoaspartate O-methyltransferase [Burkholderiales bacterium]